MSHDIHVRADGFAEMAYSGDVPWHKLGQKVTPGAKLETWAKEGGIDWTAEEAPCLYLADDGVMRANPKFKTIYRSDSKAPVGQVTEKFKTVQPLDLLEACRDLVESGGWEIETVGSLRGGSKIWVMCKCVDLVGSVYGSDKVRGRLLWATAMDGSMKTVAKFCAERVVCANTLAMALREDGDTVTVSHRMWFDADEIKESLGIAALAFDRFLSQSRRLAETPIKVDAARDLLRKLFGQPTATEIKETSSDYEFQKLMSQFKGAEGAVREQRSVGRALSLFAGEGIGSQLPGSVGTRWGLLNAVTQHVDHEMGRADDTRMDSAWFGRGDEIKTAAFELLTV